MSQPPAYYRSKDFTEDFGHETDHSALNAELDTASNSINDIRTNLAILQADDGNLRPSVVTYDSISYELRMDLVEGVVMDAQAMLDRSLAAAEASERAREKAEASAAFVRELEMTSLNEVMVLAQSAAQLASDAAQFAADAADSAAKVAEAANHPDVINKGVIPANSTVRFSFVDGDLQAATFENGPVSIEISGHGESRQHSMLLQLNCAGLVVLDFPTIYWAAPDGTYTTNISTYMDIIGRKALSSTMPTWIMVWHVDSILYGKML